MGSSAIGKYFSHFVGIRPPIRRPFSSLMSGPLVSDINVQRVLGIALLLKRRNVDRHDSLPLICSSSIVCQWRWSYCRQIIWTFWDSPLDMLRVIVYWPPILLSRKRGREIGKYLLETLNDSLRAAVLQAAHRLSTPKVCPHLTGVLT